MGTFKSTRVFPVSPELIPQTGKEVTEYFRSEGYEVQGIPLMSGGYDISVSKGNAFKAVLGMKTALKILIRPQSGQIAVDAGVGIFGQQALPTVISMLLFWPVLVTQIWGMIQQSKLDEKAITVVENSIQKQENTGASFSSTADSNMIYCTSCGVKNSSKSRFCNNCGTNLMQ